MPLLDEGQQAPDFELPDQRGRRRSLRSFLRKGPVVLYFYPKDDTPGCTKEACAFRDLHDRFVELGASVVGVSPQDSASKAAFAARHDLPFVLLADELDETGAPRVCSMFGAFGERTLYGRTFLGVIRTTYLLDRRGVVVRRWTRVRVAGHAQRVLEALEQLAAAR